ncbi:MAG: SH3 domain-containing protein [Bacteroidota bacterium]
MIRFFLFLCFIASTTLSYAQEYARVTAASGLIVRAAPQRNAKRIGKVPFGDQVKQLEKTDQQLHILDEGKSITGKWVRIAHEQVCGFVFDGFLTALPDAEKAQFQLFMPDTTELIGIKEAPNERQSEHLLYLKQYYQLAGAQDSVTLYDWSEKEVCAFVQDFEFGIHYRYENCSEEGGADEQIILPLTDLSIVRKWIEHSFYAAENVWTSETSYEPDGVGCYYEIIQQADRTVIDIYCGC